MGAHIDGFIAVVAHTVVVGGGEASGRAADVLLAAHNASEAALRLLRPGNEVSITFTNAMFRILSKLSKKILHYIWNVAWSVNNCTSPSHVSEAVVLVYWW